MSKNYISSYLEGKRAIIVDNAAGHPYSVGTEVVLGFIPIEDPVPDNLVGHKDDDYWWIGDDDFKLIDDETE